MKEAELSIVVPFFNEAKRLEPRLAQSIEYLINHLRQDWEVIFVDDGSTDGTLTLLNQTQQRFPDSSISIVSYPTNTGKGFAVKRGVMTAQGERILVTDADFSIDLDEVSKFIENLDTSDIVIGSKKHLLSSTNKHQKIPRRILGKGFTILANLVLGLNFTDITCGFRAFRSQTAKLLFPKQMMNRWSYDAETLFLAKKFNCTVQELPVKWHHIEGSKISPFKDTVRSLTDLLTIKLNDYMGKYD